MPPLPLITLPRYASRRLQRAMFTPRSATHLSYAPCFAERHYFITLFSLFFAAVAFRYADVAGAATLALIVAHADDAVTSRCRC